MGRNKKMVKNDKYGEIKGLFLISFGILCIFSLHTDSVGTVGKIINNLLMGLLSKPAYFLPYLIISWGILSLNKSFKKYRNKVLLTIISLYFSSLILYGLHFRDYIPKDIISIPSLKMAYYLGIDGLGSGIIGSIITSIFMYFLGTKGSYTIVVTFMLIIVILNTKFSIANFPTYFYKLLKNLFVSKRKKKRLIIHEDVKDENNNGSINHDIVPIDNNIDEKIKLLDYTSTKEKDINNVNNTMKTREKETTDESPQLQINNITSYSYKLPSLDLLKVNGESNAKDTKKDILIKAKLLEETLNNFGVSAKVVQVSKGPTITRYEIQPSPGVKVSRIVSLSDDIALNLAAKNIRIEAPIPGKSAIGIEIPNDNPSMVTLREVLESDLFKDNPSSLTLALGKDISGVPIVADLTKMPHLLIAGATGSGKSVCINTIITSILYKSTPQEVKLILIDPKVVELSNYNGIPHLLMPVVTDPKKAAAALSWAIEEMTRRYKYFAKKGVRDIDSYNSKIDFSTEEPLPKIVIIIDELADLMMVAPNQVEDAICRLAQMARAAGLHLIIATQRPSVDVITGVIKANIPSRIAFAVSSQADSRTILDMGGAEKLLGKGDMLFYPIGFSKPLRVQGAFISDTEVKSIVEFISSQVGIVTYEEDVISEIEDSVNSEDVDDLLQDAIEYVVSSGQASVSMLQRKFRIGYNRAARLIDEMEKRGIVSEHLGSKPRNVLISKEEFENIS